jgi:glycine hydroxymethyltransferase
MVDMAHIAGLVAAGVHPSPVPYADIVTSTTHKTLRGPRGGFILCKEEFKDRVDKAVFPGLQGGPLMHTIVAKAVAFKEAMSEDFKNYQKQVVENARAMVEVFQKDGFKVVSGGTDNHMFLLDLSSLDITGKDVETLLESINIVVNKNAVPFDEKPPTQTSGIRIGTPFMTTRGMKKNESIEIASIISEAIKNYNKTENLSRLKGQIIALCNKFPVYGESF